jgi:hypothetical protein
MILKIFSPNIIGEKLSFPTQNTASIRKNYHNNNTAAEFTTTTSALSHLHRQEEENIYIFKTHYIGCIVNSSSSGVVTQGLRIGSRLLNWSIWKNSGPN